MAIQSPVLLILTKESAIDEGRDSEMDLRIEAMVFLALELLRLIYQASPEKITLAMVSMERITNE